MSFSNSPSWVSPGRRPGPWSELSTAESPDALGKSSVQIMALSEIKADSSILVPVHRPVGR